MERIPLFIIEEHYEAFYVWHYAIARGLMPREGNTLLHVDEHSDMAAGRFKYAIGDLNGSLNAIRRFTYNELSIDTFITTAIYRNMFRQVHWVRQQHDGKSGNSAEMYVRSYNGGGKKLILGRCGGAIDHRSLSDTDIRYFTYTNWHVDDIQAGTQLVLDIDLDFFSCTGNPSKQEGMIIGISQEEYERFVGDPYHRVRYCFSRIEAIVQDGGYYYLINQYDEIYMEQTYVDAATIRMRISWLITVLKREGIVPVLINICRSRYSGYTPLDQWELIEQELCRQLGDLYPIDVLRIPETN